MCRKGYYDCTGEEEDEQEDFDAATPPAPQVMLAMHCLVKVLASSTNAQAACVSRRCIHVLQHA